MPLKNGYLIAIAFRHSEGSSEATTRNLMRLREILHCVQDDILSIRAYLRLNGSISFYNKDSNILKASFVVLRRTSSRVMPVKLKALACTMPPLMP